MIEVHAKLKKNKIKLRVARKEKSERILKASSQSCCNTMLGTQSKKTCQKDFSQHCLAGEGKLGRALIAVFPCMKGFYEIETFLFPFPW